MQHIYNIFKEKEVFQGGYMRYLKSDLKRELKRGSYIFQDGVYLSWVVKKDCIKIKKFVSKTENKGNGTKIFSIFLSMFPKLKKILKVQKKNHNAIKFYEKHNFKIVKLEKDFIFMECNE
tara:strand:+ start:660 stop:1019 length:360 start_codon:yes stop_codon:yes gene_type:complete